MPFFCLSSSKWTAMANNDARSAQHADETEQSRVSDTLNYKWLVFGLLLSRNTVSEWRVRHAIENCNLWTEHTHIIICDKLPHSMWNEACSDAVTTMSVEREREREKWRLKWCVQRHLPQYRASDTRESFVQIANCANKAIYLASAFIVLLSLSTDVRIRRKEKNFRRCESKMNQTWNQKGNMRISCVLLFASTTAMWCGPFSRFCPMPDNSQSAREICK